MNILDLGYPFGASVDDIFRGENHRFMSISALKDIPKLIQESDLVLFGGGADIHPSLYKHKNVGSYCGDKPSRRDALESWFVDLAVEHNKPMLGICRGAQLLCAKSGGWLVQHLKRHKGYEHNLITNTDKEVPMSSVHHQMMFPYPVKHELIAWIESHENPDETNTYDPDYKAEMAPHIGEKDPEIVFFPHTKSLCIQGHPEIYTSKHPAVIYTRKLVNQYLG